MTTRTSSIVLLFFGATVMAGVTVPLILATTARATVPTGPWIVPAVTLISFVAVFFLGRKSTLPTSVARSPLQSLVVLTVWMAATLLVWTLIAWVARPLTVALGLGRHSLLLLVAILVLSTALLDRVLASERFRP